ncbi:MAG: hypothetical protein HY420_02760 [Candidatus Kerfeldbacteria bacterium]|nr:hypothetical protein [Candidatus Kerfeldbacteria bacterium]
MNSCILLFGSLVPGRVVAAELERRGIARLCQLESTVAIPFMDGFCRVVGSAQFHQGLRSRLYLAPSSLGSIGGAMVGTPVTEVQERWNEQRVPIVLCGPAETMEDAKQRLRELDPSCRIGTIVLGTEAGDFSHLAIEEIVRRVESGSFWDQPADLPAKSLA